MTVCIRCHRPLKQPTPTGMGPVCAKTAKAPETHERDLFGYDLEKAERAAREAVAITVAASHARESVAIRRDYLALRVQRLGPTS